VISIIPGCSVPILLRRRNGGRESRFEFLGPCYVHGIMDGEAVELRALHEEQYPIQTFELGYTASTKVEAKSPESLQRYSPSQLHPPDRKDPETLPDDATLPEDDPPPYSSTDPLRDIMEIYFSRLSPIRYTAQSWKEYGILWTCVSPTFETHCCKTKQSGLTSCLVLWLEGFRYTHRASSGNYQVPRRRFQKGLRHSRCNRITWGPY